VTGIALKCARNARKNVNEKETTSRYDEGQENGDNEREVNHSDQTVLLTIRDAERRRLCFRDMSYSDPS